MYRTFDRLKQFDERSRNFPIRAVVPKRPRGYTWSVGAYLDQGQEGACVGFAWAHELVARPAVNRGITEPYARDLYKRAQQLDQWEGESYSGTSVIAGAKAVQERGFIKEYRWAFGLQDLILAVGYAGPVVLGVDWLEKMVEPDRSGFIHPEGNVLGGHAIVCFSVSPKNRYFRLHNSWGSSWGKMGSCKISFAGMEFLLQQRGEACVPLGRKRLQ